MVIQWNNTLKIKDVIEDGSGEVITETTLRDMAQTISERIDRFIREQGTQVQAYYWHDIKNEFERFVKEGRINIDQFDGLLDNMYDLADDDKVWIE